VSLTDVREQLQLLFTSGDRPYGLYDMPTPAIELQPAAEPIASGAYLTELGPQLYLMLTDADADDVMHDAEAADLGAGDAVHVIGNAGSATFTVTGAPVHNPGLGVPYTAIPVVVAGTAGDGETFGGRLRVQLGGKLPLPWPVHEHVPEEPAPPCAILQPSENFVSEDDDATYAGEVLVTYDVILLVLLDEEHDNADAGDQMDQLLTAVLDRVRETDDWWLLSIGQPQPMLTTEWAHHGVRVTIQTRVTL
jgi:hypothetical protein